MNRNEITMMVYISSRDLENHHFEITFFMFGHCENTIFILLINVGKPENSETLVPLKVP